MKPALYVVEAPPAVVDHFVRLCERTGLPFRVMRTEKGGASAPTDDDADDAPIAPLLLRTKRAAEVLGISESSLGRLIRRGDLPSVQVGGSKRVRVADLKAFVEQLGEAPSTDDRRTAYGEATKGRAT